MSQREVLEKLFDSICSGEYQSTVDSDKDYLSLQQAGIELLESLGYSGENVFLDMAYELNRKADHLMAREEVYLDIVVAAEITAPPYIAIKTFSNPQPDSNVLYSAAISSGANHTIGLSEEYLVVSRRPASPMSFGEVYRLSEISDDDIRQISEFLSPPDELPGGQAPGFPPGYHPDQTKLTRWLFADSDITPEYRSGIHTEHFEMDIDEYARLLYEAYSATEPNAKGEKLEEVATFLFESINDVSIRDRNLRTQSREIDIVIEHTESRKSLFSYYSRYVLVECKNRERSMDVGSVDKFAGNLRDTGVSLGIIISWNGISGEDTNSDAMRVTKTHDEEFEMIVLDSRDLYRVLDGESFYEIIDSRLYAQQFDL